jgi:hypothetical protein
MISSDLHGAKEPIRWTLGWQRQDRVYDEPIYRGGEGRPHQDIWHRLWLMGISPWQMDVDHDGQDATSDVGRLPGHVAASLGLFGTCDMMLEPQEGQRFTHLVVIMP